MDYFNTTIKISGYRPFRHPQTLHLRNGVTSFIGPNNSGKSSILRFFYDFRQLFAEIRSPGNWRQTLTGQRRSFKLPQPSRQARELFNNYTDDDLEFTILDYAASNDDLRGLKLIVFRDSLEYVLQIAKGNSFIHLPNFDFKSSGDRTILTDSQKSYGHIDRIINILAVFHTTMYIPSFRNAINIGSTTSYFDIDVGQIFIHNWRELKYGYAKEGWETAEQTTRTIREIMNYDDLEINPSSDDQTLQLRINGHIYRLDEVGSGITQLIIIAINIALSKASMIMIDEPEAGLHPLLQRNLIELLRSFGSIVLFTTHSIGLSRHQSEVIYSITRDDINGSSIKSFEHTPRLSEFAGEMNFGGAVEIGVSKILLVEGPTDIKVYQQFLRKIHKEPEFLILHLGGSSSINGKRDTVDQLNELKRITPNITAIIDSESTSEGSIPTERRNFRRICVDNGIDCHVLEYRSTESYFSAEAIRSVHPTLTEKLKPYEKTPDGWAKADNWRMAQLMDLKDVEGTDLSRILSKLEKAK